jgi:hypothetical protein
MLDPQSRLPVVDYVKENRYFLVDVLHEMKRYLKPAPMVRSD